MIAYLDAEFNCGISYPEKAHDSSLLEVALIITHDIKSSEIVAQYQSYCKPELNQGRIYPIIKGMTHINQADIDKGKSYPEIFRDLKALIQEYNISAIYVWGNFDRRGFLWNCSRYPEIKDAFLLTNIVTDISKDCINKIGINYEMALKDIAYICNCMTEKQHNAVDDTKMLAAVVCAINNGRFDPDKVTEYSLYLKHRDAYNALKKAVKKVKECDGNLEEFLKMADRNMGFPHFIYQKNK